MNAHHEAITARWRALAATAAGITPNKVGPYPTVADAQGLVEDLNVLCVYVDALVAAYGDYARHALGVSERDVKEDFTSQLFTALHGNAMFVLEEAARDYAESAADQRADYERDRRRDDAVGDR